jgi:hypothetical protein
LNCLDSLGFPLSGVGHAADSGKYHAVNEFEDEWADEKTWMAAGLKTSAGG